jgi:hypothetical protein
MANQSDHKPDLRTEGSSLPGEEQLALERAKLRQERELKEKELVLRDKELNLQLQQSRWARWSTPVVLAIVAGLIGYFGTLISSHQSLQLEREKQEAMLILEAIKTTGTAPEKEKQTAANLVFFADAGLIKSIKKAELDKLRVKAQGAGPSLPAAKGVVEFERSVTTDLQSKLQSALAKYQDFLVGVGYDSVQAKDRVTVRIDEEGRENAYFVDNSIVLGPNLAGDPEYVLSEYTWYVLKQSNPLAFETLISLRSYQYQGFTYGLKFYFPCSYLNEPYVGRSYYSLSGETGRDRSRPYLFNLDQLKAFSNTQADREPHKLGEIWGSAFWEMRKKLGPKKTDRLLFATWRRFQAVSRTLNKPRFYVNTIMDAAKAGGNEQDIEVIRQAFASRNLY